MSPFDATSLEDALKELCQTFPGPPRVEILIVGGAAAMITGVLPAERTTSDCDVASYFPGASWPHVERLADEIGAKRGWPSGWLNGNVQTALSELPQGWQQRRILVYGGDWLVIYAASRLDLIATKFYAGRPQDLQDLAAMHVRVDEREFARRYVQQLLSAAGSDQEREKAADATSLVDSWDAE